MTISFGMCYLNYQRKDELVSGLVDSIEIKIFQKALLTIEGRLFSKLFVFVCNLTQQLTDLLFRIIVT